MPTRQQKRAKKRAPQRGVPQRRRQTLFWFVIIALVLGGGATAAFVRTSPRPIQRGAIQGEHWHATYRIELCGKKLNPYPFVEGEVHTHGDGKIHIHPHTAAFTGDNANLGHFLESVETAIGIDDGKRFFVLPNGTRYEDGGACPGDDERYDLLVRLNGRAVDGDPFGLILHDDDDLLIRFGPEATESTANPLVPSPTPEG